MVPVPVRARELVYRSRFAHVAHLQTEFALFRTTIVVFVLHIAFPEMRSALFKSWIVNFKMRIVNFEMRIVNFEMRIVIQISESHFSEYTSRCSECELHLSICNSRVQIDIIMSTRGISFPEMGIEMRVACIRMKCVPNNKSQSPNTYRILHNANHAFRNADRNFKSQIACFEMRIAFPGMWIAFPEMQFALSEYWLATVKMQFAHFVFGFTLFAMRKY